MAYERNHIQHRFENLCERKKCASQRRTLRMGRGRMVTRLRSNSSIHGQPWGCGVHRSDFPYQQRGASVVSARELDVPSLWSDVLFLPRGRRVASVGRAPSDGPVDQHRGRAKSWVPQKHPVAGQLRVSVRQHVCVDSGSVGIKPGRDEESRFSVLGPATVE